MGEGYEAGQRLDRNEKLIADARRLVPEDMSRPLGGRRCAEATALPAWIKPQLTKLVDEPPEGAEWLHEIKFDGYRMHARLDRRAASDPQWPRLDA